MERIQYGVEGRRCPICERKITQPGWAYCSLKCKDDGESKKPIRGVNNKEVDELMRQWRQGNWTKVDGW